MKEAMFYSKQEGRKVQCFLCAHRCIIPDRKRGKCRVRENRGGSLFSLVYGRIVSMNIDPIEKKPLFHFRPGTTSLSISTVGCNFRCSHCQNFEIAQYPKERSDIPGDIVTPEDVVDAAERAGCESISYTYTEPTIFFEFAYDCACIAHERGIKNIFVSNGYTGLEATRAIAPFLDANNIDLKGDNDFYNNICGAKLEPVRETIKLMKELGVWVEITTLIIPTCNDSDKTISDIIDFIVSVDPSIPWHITQFYPTYKLQGESRTPVETLRRIRARGIEKGLKYIYTGNVMGEVGENTYCSNCQETIIERYGYRTLSKIEDGACFKCSTRIEGIWK